MTMNEEWLDNLEDTIEDFPDEVRDFIFGEDLKNVKEILDKQVNTDEQKLQLNNMLMFFLLQGKTEKELNDFIETLEVSDNQKLAIRAIIQEKVINELVLIIEANKELEGENSGEPTTKTDSSLSSLSDRLKQATIAMPGKKDYSPGKPVVKIDEVSSTSSGATAAIDPYHEPIDNE